MEFEHEIALQEFNTSYSKMPLAIKTRIQNWEREKTKVYNTQDPDPAALRALHAKSVMIAQEIQDFIEIDLADEEEESTPNTNNMLSDADKTRAKALGLDENTTTLAEIEAKEKEKADKEAADKAAADKEAADKAAKDKEAADKASADKAAADKAAAEAAASQSSQSNDDDDIFEDLL